MKFLVLIFSVAVLRNYLLLDTIINPISQLWVFMILYELLICDQRLFALNIVKALRLLSKGLWNKFFYYYYYYYYNYYFYYYYYYYYYYYI